MVQRQQRLRDREQRLQQQHCHRLLRTTIGGWQQGVAAQVHERRLMQQVRFDTRHAHAGLRHALRSCFHQSLII